MAQLQAGEAQLEAGEDAALGRTRSLAASLSYGFAQAFTDAERAQLAVLHLFRDTADVDASATWATRRSPGRMRCPSWPGWTARPGSRCWTGPADIGLLESLGGGYYQIHPALPWYFTTLYTTSYGQPDSPAAQRATRAYSRAIGELGNYYHDTS